MDYNMAFLGGGGGGIYNHGTLTLTNSTLAYNTASSSGGGIRNDGTLTLTNSTLAYNTTVSGNGGGIYSTSGTLTLTNCSLTNNTAHLNGGGILNGGTLTLTNNTLAYNTAVGGDDGGGSGGGIGNGGLYFGTEDKHTGRYTEHGGTTGKLDLSVPWTKKDVRQAMNKAINRDELLKVLYKGRATPMYVHGYYPDLPGWDPTWEQRFPEMYGYDPAAAKRPLAQAGYPQGFKGKMWVYPFAGAPELIALLEAIQVQWRDVGIDMEPEEADVVANVLPMTRERKANGYVESTVPSKKAVETQIALFNAGKGTPHNFETDELYAMWEQLLQTADPQAADALLRQIGNYKFEQFETIPLFNVKIEIVVDPKVVNDWPFPGWDGGDIGHTFLISACKQQKPCK